MLHFTLIVKCLIHRLFPDHLEKYLFIVYNFLHQHSFYSFILLEKYTFIIQNNSYTWKINIKHFFIFKSVALWFPITTFYDQGAEDLHRLTWGEGESTI